MNIKNILTALTLLISLNLSAKVEPSIITGANKTFTVDLADWADFAVDVEITDTYGHTLLNDIIDGAKGKIYNLKNLENGVYNVAVSNSTKIINTTITVAYDNVTIDNTDTVYRPVVLLGKEHFDVNVLTQGKPIFVKVYDQNRQVYTANYYDTDVVNERFVLSQLPAGNYSITVSKGTDQVSYTIVK